jgi:hypothetical protein
VNELLDKAKAITGSDNKTAKLLEIPQPHVSDIRNGRRALTPYQAARLAELVGERWYDAALPVMAAKAKSQKERGFWLGKLEPLRKTAARVLLVASLAATPQRGAQIGQESGPLPGGNEGGPALYIMLTLRAAFKAIFRTLAARPLAALPA